MEHSYEYASKQINQFRLGLNECNSDGTYGINLPSTMYCGVSCLFLRGKNKLTEQEFSQAYDYQSREV